MNWAFAFQALNAAALVASGILNAYLWFKSKTDQRFDAIQESLARLKATVYADREEVRRHVAERKAQFSELTERVALVEEKLEHLPTHDDLAELHAKLGVVGNEVAATSERSKILLDGMRRIEQHLMDR